MSSKASLKKMENMFDGSLPIVNAEVVVRIEKIPSETQVGTFDIIHVRDYIPVEILTLNFNTKTMRVRYIAALHCDEPTVQCVDICAKKVLENFNFKG